MPTTSLTFPPIYKELVRWFPIRGFWKNWGKMKNLALVILFAGVCSFAKADDFYDFDDDEVKHFYGIIMLS